MTESFGSGSSAKVFQWLTQYKKLSERSPASLSEDEKTQLAELQRKLGALLHKNSSETASQQVIDHRSALRINVEYQVEMMTVGDFQKAYIRNISGGGLFVETANLAPLHTKVKLQLTLPNETQPISISGEISWINPRRTAAVPQGVGVKFLDLSEPHRRKIQKFVNMSLETALKDGGKEKKK
jgi:uncharacterized protein (TIGR02266 family)